MPRYFTFSTWLAIALLILAALLCCFGPIMAYGQCTNPYTGDVMPFDCSVECFTNCPEVAPPPYILTNPIPITLSWNYDSTNSPYHPGITFTCPGYWAMIWQSSNGVSGWVPLLEVPDGNISNSVTFNTIYRYQFYRVQHLPSE